MTTVARGTHSDIMEPREVVVRSLDDWRALWKAHGSSQPPPSVDFSRSMVVAVFLGERPTAGYEVEITAVKAQGGRAVVEYVERRPAPDALVAQVLTSPFHIVSLSRSAGTPEFRKIESPR
ncbi:MAG: protease complex subunit PrcB family protein [Acidobacteria bacterium]|nr:protease complex subunit PrcB family protein [Acidobacteriota bacterium]